MKTKNVLFIVAASVVILFTIMAFIADKVVIGVTHY
ncbi:hypothetical protein DSM02_1769 [Leeuwenhoekiella polynyae]|uniref:Uncharacterized protein n=1 Tax=Leeuwenhoekiella polynyae TaxID=1550906 RepID=A0A4Q0P8J7_9FLAO|nr:hypothetical protein DSM02_1769 [Leeuwenhoekiella polynyae]|tara:strand:- start:307 stop:414 length:108 start_codon:yes stop_codon:yes gene_type:complete